MPARNGNEMCHTHEPLQASSFNGLRSQDEMSPYTRLVGVQGQRAEAKWDITSTQSSSSSKTSLSQPNAYDVEVGNAAINHPVRDIPHNEARSGTQNKEMLGQATTALHRSKEFASRRSGNADDMIVDLTNHDEENAQRKRQRVNATATSKNSRTSGLLPPQQVQQQLQSARGIISHLRHSIDESQQSNQQLMKVAIREETAKNSLARQVAHMEGQIAHGQSTNQHLIKEVEWLVGTNIEKDATIERLRAELEPLKQTDIHAKSTRLKIIKIAATAKAKIAAIVAAREYKIRGGLNDLHDSTSENLNAKVLQLRDLSDGTSLLVNRLVDDAMAVYREILSEEEYEVMKTAYVHSRHRIEAKNLGSKAQDGGHGD